LELRESRLKEKCNNALSLVLCLVGYRNVSRSSEILQKNIIVGHSVPRDENNEYILKIACVVFIYTKAIMHFQAVTHVGHV
jgi:hypothetical protein